MTGNIVRQASNLRSYYVPVGSGYAPEMNGSALQPNGYASRVKYSTFVYAAFFMFANLACCWYYIAFPLVNMRPVFGYPAAPAQYTFETTRYISVEYWMVYFLVWNILLVDLLCHALMNNTLVEFGGIHHFLSRVGMVWNGIIFLILTFLWLFFCNGDFTGGALCNDPRWCGVYYTSSSALSWCPNTVNFVPDVTYSQIYRSDEFFQAWLFSIFFMIWALANKSINRYLHRKGMFRELFVAEDTSNGGDDDDQQNETQPSNQEKLI